MRFFKTILLALLAALLLFFLNACDVTDSVTEKNDLTQKLGNRVPTLNFAVAPHIAWMPWYLAEDEGFFYTESAAYPFQVKFISENDNESIDRFIAKEIHAIAISNIDAIAQFVKRNLKVDVILITNQHLGSEAILVPKSVEITSQSLHGKTFALAQYSSRHYLLDRYLIRHQVPFEAITILNTTEDDLPKKLDSQKV